MTKSCRKSKCCKCKNNLTILGDTGVTGPVGNSGTGGTGNVYTFFIETATGPTADNSSGPFTIFNGSVIKFIGDGIIASTGSVIVDFRNFIGLTGSTGVTGPTGPPGPFQFSIANSTGPTSTFSNGPFIVPDGQIVNFIGEGIISSTGLVDFSGLIVNNSMTGLLDIMELRDIQVQIISY